MMTERHSSEFDDHDDSMPTPQHAGDPSTRPSSSRPVALQPYGEEFPPAGPAFGHGQWPSPPPPSDPAEVPHTAPAEPLPGGAGVTPDTGAHRSSPSDSETTAIVDRDWLTQQIDRHQTTRDRTATPHRSGYGTTNHWDLDAAALFGGGDHTVAAHDSDHGSAPQQRLGTPEFPEPSWQQPTPGEPPSFPPPRPGFGRDADQPASPGGYDDWSAAQGSAASWTYVDNIRSSEMVPTRRIPPGRGWRKALYLSTFKLINPGQSPDERYEAELRAKVRSGLRGTYKIGVLGKGGVGKSTTAAGVGSIFADLRQDDRVVAVDADTAFGKLAARIDPTASGSYWEVAGDENLTTFADMRARVGSNAAGLFVLGGAPETARRRVLDPEVYRRATAQLDRHFTLSIIDCGSTMDSAITREVLSDVDALIVVSSPWYDGASAAGQTLEWLANGGYTALLHRTVVVVNDSDGHADTKDLKVLVDRFGKYGQKVILVPYDRHLRPGGVIDIDSEINPLTRRRLLELAADCAEHFAATTDRPRHGTRAGDAAASSPQRPASGSR